MERVDFIQTMEGFGLSQKAALVYVSLLGKQKMTVSEISRETGVKRATCYEHLDILLARDFVIRVPVGKRMFYSGVDPRRILVDFKKRTSLLEQKMAEMQHVHDSAVNRPRVVFYEGKREIKRIYEDLFKTIGDVYTIFPAATFFENFTEEDYNEFDRSVSQHALTSRDLFVADKYYKKIQEIRAKNSSASKSGKRLPENFKSNVDVLIFSDKVALISLRDLSAIVIENKDIADLFRNMHSFMWKGV